MTRSFVRQRAYIAAGSIVLAILAIGVAFSLGCRPALFWDSSKTTFLHNLRPADSQSSIHSHREAKAIASLDEAAPCRAVTRRRSSASSVG
jgi:hypothetical protein